MTRQAKTRHTITKNSRLLSAASITVFILLLGFISVFSYHYGWQWLDSDNASEMMLGKLLANENAFVSTNWFYSTEIRLVYQTLFTMPLFKLLGQFNNWALIRSINILLNNLVLFLSYLFMMKSMKVQTKWVLVSSIFLLVPLSIPYWDIVSFGGYYIFFIAQFFFCLGFFVRFALRDEKGSSWVSFVVFVLLSFALGAQTVRSLLIIFIPLLITCAYLWHAKKNVPGGQKYILVAGFCGFAANCAGYAVNGLLHHWYSFNSYGSMNLDFLYDNFLPKLSKSLAYLAGLLGFTAGIPFASIHGLFSIAAIIAAVLIFHTVYRVFRGVGAHNAAVDKISAQQFMAVLFFVSSVFNIFVFVIINQTIEIRYLIPFMVLIIPLGAFLFEYAGTSYGSVKRTALICGITLFIFGQGCFNFVALSSRDVNTVRKGYVQYLIDNKLDFGFATYWNANVTTELSNGKIEMAGLEPRIRSGVNANQFRILPSLIPKKYFDPSYYKGESFLLLTNDEWDLVKMRISFSGLKPGYEDKNFVVIRYPSAEIIHREVLEL